MSVSNKPKRRNKVDKVLKNKAIQDIEKNARDRDIPELKDLALAINQRLLDLGENQEWLVDETGIGKATISAYCHAESMPNGVNLVKLSKALETTPDYLLGFTTTPSTDISTKAIHAKTGLSATSIEILEKHYKRELEYEAEFIYRGKIAKKIGVIKTLNALINACNQHESFLQDLGVYLFSDDLKDAKFYVVYGNEDDEEKLNDVTEGNVNGVYLYSALQWLIKARDTIKKEESKK